MPSAVDGRPGYRADPLANDQDWCLTLWLRLLDSGDDRARAERQRNSSGPNSTIVRRQVVHS